MKVFFDTSPLTSGHKGRGVGTYTQELVEVLKNKIELVSDHVQADVIHYPYFDFFFHTLPINKTKPTVVTIHDTIPLIYPNQFPRGVKGTINLLLQKFSLGSVAAIITDSQNSKKDIGRYFSIKSPKITPIPLAPNSSIKPQPKLTQQHITAKYHLPSEFLLYVGDINFNKNLPFLIQTIASIPTHLAIVTRADINSSIPESVHIQHAMKKTSNTSILNVGSTKELSSLYSAAKFYIQPSLYEGFGLPVLESFACKTPVICAKTSSLPEVAGDAAIYFDPKNQQSLIKSLETALSLNATQYQTLVKKSINQLKKFSWEKTARQTVDVYQKVLADR